MKASQIQNESTESRDESFESMVIEINKLLNQNEWKSFNEAERICINLFQKDYDFNKFLEIFLDIQREKYFFLRVNSDLEKLENLDSKDVNFMEILNVIDQNILDASEAVKKSLLFIQILKQFELDEPDKDTSCDKFRTEFTSYETISKKCRKILSNHQRKHRPSLTSYITRQTNIIKKIAKTEQEKQPKTPIPARFEYTDSKTDKHMNKIQVHLSYLRPKEINQGKFPLRERDQVRIMPEFLTTRLKGQFPENLSDLGTIISIRGKNWTRDPTQVVVRCDSIDALTSIEEKEGVCLQPFVNDVISKRCINCLNEIQLNRHKVVDMLLANVENPDLLPEIKNLNISDKNTGIEKIKKMEFQNKSLDSTQKSAVTHCATTYSAISVIQGPPGTGKTTVLAEIIYQLSIVQNKTVLISAQSNIAVDTLLEKFVELLDDVQKKKVVRIVSQETAELATEIAQKYKMVSPKK